MARSRYVVKKAASGWDVVKEGDRRASARTTSKADAVRQATKLTRKDGGGEVVVLGRAGKVADTSRVARTSNRRGKSGTRSVSSRGASRRSRKRSGSRAAP